MSVNPYAPPKSEVGDVVDGELAPALWNPGAAAGWSLLLSPAFGAFLHMRNWQALGEPEKAATSRTWIVISISVLLLLAVGAAFLPDSKAIDGLSRIVGLALLLSWYYSIGKSQVAVVKGRFGKVYPRKGWTKPLLVAVAAFVAFVAFAVAISVVASAFSR